MARESLLTLARNATNPRWTWASKALPWGLALLVAPLSGCLEGPFLMPDGPTRPFSVYLTDQSGDITSLNITIEGVTVGVEATPLQLVTRTFDILAHHGPGEAVLVAAGAIPEAAETSRIEIQFSAAEATVDDEVVGVAIPKPVLTVAAGTSSIGTLLDLDMLQSVTIGPDGLEFTPHVAGVYALVHLEGLGSDDAWDLLEDNPAQDLGLLPSLSAPSRSESPESDEYGSESGAPSSPAPSDSSTAGAVQDEIPALPCDEVDECLQDLHKWIVRVGPRLHHEGSGPADGYYNPYGQNSWNFDEVNAVEDAARDQGAVILFRYRMAPAFAAIMSTEKADTLRQDPRVANVESGETPVEFHSFVSAKAATQWNDLQANALGVVDYANLAWTGAGVGIAIIDTGVDGTHPDLKYDADHSRPPSAVVYENFKMVSIEGVPAPNSDLTGGHGTHVAGIMVGQATSTAAFVAGVSTQKGLAPGSKLYAFGSGEATTILWATQAFDALLWWMDNGDLDPAIRVVQNSWSLGTGYDASSLVTWQVNEVVDRDAVVVFSTGNDGGDGSVNKVSGQCRIPREGVVCVGGYEDSDTGSASSGTLYAYSSRGASATVATWPDLVAPATRILSTKPAASTVGGATAVYYGLMSGTSVAAPMVSAAVALMLEADASLTPAEVEACLESTADEFASGGAYATDADARWNGSHFAKGHGLLDIEGAVESADAGAC